jgi:hypothetical protein
LVRCGARASGRRAYASAGGRGADATGQDADGSAAGRGRRSRRGSEASERVQEQGGSGRMCAGEKRARGEVATGGEHGAGPAKKHTRSSTRAGDEGQCAPAGWEELGCGRRSRAWRRARRRRRPTWPSYRLLAKNLVDETAAMLGFPGDVVIYGADVRGHGSAE